MKNYSAGAQALKKGTVKFFNTTRGFGFIVDSESKQDVFVHISGLADQIYPGDEVIFAVSQGKRGFSAVNVKRT